MTLQQILSPLRRAVSKYSMISNGDRIVVGLSGGKDSLVLLTALNTYRRFCPQSFELAAVTVDMGLGADYEPLKEYCAGLNVPYQIEQTNIGEILFEIRREKNPCSLCSKLRRGALNAAVIKRGFNKLALGHHADDLAETLLLSLFYEGRFSTFSPIGFMDRSGVTLIRPLILVEEKNIAACAAGLPVVHNPCPADHATQREYMKNLLKNLQRDIPFAKDRLLGAITNPARNNLWRE